jgi:hypothetical protein
MPHPHQPPFASQNNFDTTLLLCNSLQLLQANIPHNITLTLLLLFQYKGKPRFVIVRHRCLLFPCSDEVMRVHHILWMFPTAFVARRFVQTGAAFHG